MVASMSETGFTFTFDLHFVAKLIWFPNQLRIVYSAALFSIQIKFENFCIYGDDIFTTK